MRWTAVILLSIFLFSFVVADIPDDCDSSMISYWKFDGDASDSYINNNDGIGGDFSGELLAVNESASFSGSESVEVSTIGDLGSSFTIEMMIQDSSLFGSASAVLFDKGNYSIGFDSSRYIVVSVDGTTIGSNNAISRNTPYHVAFVQDDSEIILYLNGIEQDSGSVSSPSSAGDITIGSGFEGLIDEVAVYSSAFDWSTVSKHYSKANAGYDYCDLMGSGANTQFTIAGCDTNNGGMFAGTCSVDREFYCSDEGNEVYELQSVYNIEGACSYGESEAPGAGEPQCCPSGFVCKDNEDGAGLICNQRTQSCSVWDENEDACEDDRCYWLDDLDRCVDNPAEYSCDIYGSKNSCNSDTYGVGQTGFEAREKCGTYFYDAAGGAWGYSDCSCEWDSVEENCNLGYKVECFIGEDCGSLRCSKNFEIGECISGSQLVGWKVNITEISGSFDSSSDWFNQTIYDEVIATSCSDSNGTSRACGSEVVKLPGFSLFSFVAAVGILGLFYYFKRD